MDRCALFVDAGYVLSDGAMAVHGTRHRESVSWNYAGLLQFLGSVARDRTGLPLLRCYWYEATVEGRRSSDHDTLADLPGVKLRLGRMRPGRREGVESEIHRDLTTLARYGALRDALVVSAEEDLAQVIADVDHKNLNVDVPWMQGAIPTTEVFAERLWERLGAVLAREAPQARLAQLVLHETPNNKVTIARTTV